MKLLQVDDACMERALVLEAELVESGAVRRRRWRTVEEKRGIVEATLAPGTSVSQIAREHGVNSNQVFHRRRQYMAGDLSLPVDSPTNFLPVHVSDASESRDEITSEEPVKRSGGVIHVEFPGRVLVSIESGVDPALAIAVLERLMR